MKPINVTATITHLEWVPLYNESQGVKVPAGELEVAIVEVCLGDGLGVQRLTLAYPHETCKPGMQVTFKLDIMPVREMPSDVMRRGNVQPYKGDAI